MLWLSYFGNNVQVPKHSLWSQSGHCGLACCSSRTVQFLCQSDLVHHMLLACSNSLSMLLPQSVSQTWILPKTKCNELRGCTQTATTAPMTCHNSLCGAKSDNPHLLQNNEAVHPNGWISSASALSLAPSALRFGRNPTKWQAVRKNCGWLGNSWLLHQRLSMQ